MPALVLASLVSCGTSFAKDFSHDAPMTFYLARGGPNACGPDCSEWIVAEGTIGIGSVARFRSLLKRLGKQKLPVIFNSPGGLAGEAMAMGRLLRERSLPAAVGRTNPNACAGEPNTRFCDDLKKSNKTLDADLQIKTARCSSALAYALLGSKVRTVWPGTRLGVHAALPISIQGGRIRLTDQPKTPQRQKVASRWFTDKLRTYLREMGIDVRLVDVADAVPHESVHYLTRDQIVEFGIDSSEFRETPWTFGDNPIAVPEVYKLFVEPRGEARKEFPLNEIRLACGFSGGSVAVFYSRGLPSGGTTTMQISLVTAGGEIPVSTARVYQYDWIEQNRFFDAREGDTSFAVLQAGSNAPEIIETSWAPPAPYTHIIRLSSNGWDHAIEKLRQKCVKRR